MFTLYRLQDCKACSAVEDVMDEMVLRHKTVVVKDLNELPEAVRDAKLPLLLDENEKYQGFHNIIDHLEEVAEFKGGWQRGISSGPSYDL